jgi:hypothetical protein
MKSLPSEVLLLAGLLTISFCHAEVSPNNLRAEVVVAKKEVPANEPLMPIVPVEAWEKEFHQKLQKKITCDFSEMALDDALNILRQAAEVNMIIDPRMRDAGDYPKVNLKLDEDTVENGLMQVMQNCELNYRLRDEAMFIFHKGAIAARRDGPLGADEVARLNSALNDLGAEDFDTRERASAFVQSFGPAAAPVLEVTLKQSRDPEVIARVRNILAVVRMTDLFYESSDVGKKLNALNKQVTFEFSETPGSDALTFLQSFVPELKLLSEGEIQTVSLKVSNMQLGNALRWLARCGRTQIATEGLVIKLHSDTPSSQPVQVGAQVPEEEHVR